MNAKNNRVNHDFQIVYFLIGSCHTPDAAFSLLCDLQEDRMNALALSKSADLRNRAKAARAKKKMGSDDESTQLDAQADLAEIEALAGTVAKNIKAAEAELATIQLCMEKLQPLRKYANLSLPAAHEAAQKEEWKLELISRAQNYMLTIGSIPVDQFATMRMHPEFTSAILPKIEEIKVKLVSGNLSAALEALPMPTIFDLPKLLESK